MPEDKGLNRGGTGGQQGELGEDPQAERDLQRGIQGEKLDKGNQQQQKRNEQQRPDQKQQQDKQKIQPTHQVD